MRRWIDARDDALNDRGCRRRLLCGRWHREQRTSNRRSEDQATVIWERFKMVPEVTPTNCHNRACSMRATALNRS